MRKKKQDDGVFYFGLAFADVLISFIAIFIVLFTLVAILPKAVETSKTADSLGKICAEITWPANRRVDLDIWGASPEENYSVGYSNMHGQNLDLYRDVLDSSADDINLEIICAKRIVPGEWTFNVNYYANHETPTPADQRVMVTMEMTVQRPGHADEHFKAQYNINNGEEKTLLDFRIDQNGEIIRGSINSNYRKLRAKEKVN